MANYGADRARMIEGLVDDLMHIHAYGAEAWRTSGGAISLEHILKLRQVTEASKTAQSPAEAIWDVVQRVCQGLLNNYTNSALAYFGYPYHFRSKDEDPATSPTARIAAAAKCIPISGRRFGENVQKGRAYQEQRFGSYETLILNVVACELADVEMGSPGPLPPDLPPPVDVQDHYRRTPHSDLQQHGFFEHESTASYIHDIAELARDHAAPITIYAGAGVSADVGDEPLRSQFMERLLAQLVQKSDLLKETASTERDAVAKRISHAVAQTYTTPYLGSIVRELVRRQANSQNPDDLRTMEADLQHDIRNLLEAGYIPGRFVATAIAACAFAMRRVDANVEVVTSNYDHTLTRAAEHVRTPLYLPEDLTDYRFVVKTNPDEDGKDRPPQELSQTEVGVTHLNGSIDSAKTHLVIGEGDFFADYGAGLEPEEEYSTWRHKLLTDKLERTVCIFVGSTLTDPDVLEHLARTKHRNRRYALLLRPRFELYHDANSPETAQLRSIGTFDNYIGRELVAQRFLHLGVVPIIAEHPHHIPQFLREITLKVLQGDAYRPYGSRAKMWWGYWAKSFGHKPGPDGPPGPRSKNLQEHWQTKPLAEAMKQLRKAFATDKRPQIEDEHIMLEVWLRNPHQRDLVLWARSDSHWLDAATAHHASLRGEDSGYIAQKTFQQGWSMQEPLHGRRGQWRYYWSMPLVLYQEPWYHLPVGVLNVLSNKAKDDLDTEGTVSKYAQLMNAADSERGSGREAVEQLEDSLKQIMRRELDPQSSTWQSKERPDWSSYVKRFGRRRS